MYTQQKIKVAILAQYLQATGGGSSRHIECVTEYLSRRDDVVLHIISAGYMDSKFDSETFNIHAIGKSSSPFYIPFLARSLYRKTIDINPDIVHAIGTGLPYSTAAAFLRNKYPTLLTIMGLSLKDVEYIKGIRHIYTKLVKVTNERYVISKVPSIIVQSPYIEKLIDGMTRSRVYVVPEGIEFKEIQGITAGGFDERIDIFIAVRLWKLKGIDVLIKAIPKVTKSVADLKVYIAGRGEEAENYKALVNHLGVEENVRFLGFVSEEEKNKYYKACRIVVVPSRWDVDPFAPLNAAASGKPAIVSDMCNSSVTEDGKNGFIFKSEDSDELADRIIKLLVDDTLREEMGKSALEKAKRYDYSEIVKSNVEIYREVISDFHKQNSQE